MNCKKKFYVVCVSCGCRFYSPDVALKVNIRAAYGLCDNCYRRLIDEMNARSFAEMVPHGTK